MDGFSDGFTFDLGDPSGLGEAAGSAGFGIGFGGFGPGDTSGQNPGGATLDRNLRALSIRSPFAARRIAAATPSTAVHWVDSEEDAPGLVLRDTRGEIADPFGLGGLGGIEADTPAAERVLASRRRPVTEGKRLAESVDVIENGAVCVLGFGAGYHCRALGERMGDQGVVACFEPDIALLRAVFERVDHSAWIEKTNFVLFTDAGDGAAVSAGMRGLEAIMGIGIRMLEHPASRPRLGDSAARFGRTFADAVRSMRTSLVTTLVRAQASLSNMVMNAECYAASGGIEGLTGAAYGRPAIVVSAGPSLECNLALLEDPRVREHAVIIAVQTMLKPLLRRGIKPHFVCALDYHELSRRFYEGLTAEDVEGVTLVIEPKANPAIAEAFPGRILCVQEPLLDQVLGADLAGQKWPLKAGATVAHLCAYLARHLGCDPLILIGQDLGFTDGQYYAAGAAIHDVWAGEVTPVRTLEMFEWERIVRGRGLLRKLEDIHGRAIYTDEQMATYLSQFEVDFAEDERRGLRVIDATEGGVRKAHTSVMTLAGALEMHLSGEPVSLESGMGGGAGGDTPRRVAGRLEEVAAQADEVERHSREAVRLLRQMLKVGPGTGATNALIDEVYRVRDAVRLLEPAYGLVQFVNQAGAMRRFKADRAIDLRTMDENDRQRAQIERDVANVEWTADAASELARLLRDAAAAARGEKKRVTQDAAPVAVEPVSRAVRVAAMVMFDDRVNGLGLPRRDVMAETAAKEPALRGTVRRLLAAPGLDEIVVATGSPEIVRTLLADAGDDPRVAIEHVDGERLRARTRAVGRARLMAPDTWRSGLGGLSCYDESFEPGIAAELMEARSLDAAVLVGPDWMLVDPGLVGAVVARYREQPESVKLSLTQAAPGLAGLLLDRETVESIAAGVAQASDFASSYASVGGLLAYLPIAPQPDPIAKAFCVAVPHAVRDAGRRFIPDVPAGEARIARVLAALGPGWFGADAEAMVRAAPIRLAEAPRHMHLELCTGRLAGGLFGQWLCGGKDAERPVMHTGEARKIVEAFARGRPDTVLTLHGVGDPLMHPGVFEVIGTARAAGVGLVHLRTDALSDAWDVGRLVSSGVDAVSVDVLAASAETYRVMAGVDRYEEVKTRVESLLSERGVVAGLPGVWVMPRITRCDEVYNEIEMFYDGWLMTACSAVIDPAPAGADLGDTARIRPLPLPQLAWRRMLRETLVVRSDGRAVSFDGAALGDLMREPIEKVWKMLGRGPRVAA